MSEEKSDDANAHKPEDTALDTGEPQHVEISAICPGEQRDAPKEDPGSEFPPGAVLVVNHDVFNLSPAGLPPIVMQAGVRPDVFRNGYLDTEILSALRDRLARFQRGPLACEETARAITKIDAAIELLMARSKRRKTTGIYGTDQESPQVS